MPGLFVAIFLVASLFVVHRSVRTRPMQKDEALDAFEQAGRWSR